jgi:competence protein ComEC
MGLIPVSAIFYGYSNLTTIISSPIAMMICEFSIFYSIISIPFLFIPIPGIFIIFKPLQFSLDFLIYSARLFSNYSFYISNLFIYKLIIIISILIFIYITQKYFNKLVVIILIFSIISIFYYNNKKNIIVSFIDIGQGDSILFETEKNFFIDVGDNLNGSFDRAIKPYLLRNNIKIDSVIITHIDNDHSGNCENINLFLRNIKFYFPITLKNSKKFKKFVERKKLSENRIFFLKKGDNLKFGSVKLEVLWPEIESEKSKNDDNYNSLVILAQTPIGKILLTGDIPKSVERKIMKSIKGEVKILKVSHHGSKTATSLSFLKKIKPKFSIISAGFMNKHKHPNREVIYNLSKSGTTIMDTISYGMIQFIKKEGEKFWIKTSRVK